MVFNRGSPKSIATMGFLAGAPGSLTFPISVATRGWIITTAKIADIVLLGSAPTTTVINGLTTYFYPGSDGLKLSGIALVTTKINGIISPTIPGLGGIILSGIASTVTIINGKFIADYQPVTDNIILGGSATVVAKLAGQTSVVYVGNGIILISGSAKQEFITFLKTLHPLQPPLPGPLEPAALILPEYVVEQKPIIQFQKNDISSNLYEIGGEQLHLFQMQLFGNRDFEFVMLIRPWSIAVDFVLETWISDTPLGKPIGKKTNITFREITFFYIKEETLEVWQGEKRIFHAIIDLQNNGNYYFHVDNLENRKINKYAMKIETFTYGQTKPTTIIDLVNQTETVFNSIGEFGRITEGNVEL